MFNLEMFRRRDSPSPATKAGAPKTGARNPTARRLRGAGTLAEQRRMLSPSNPGLQVPRPAPTAVAEAEQESVDITVIDDSDFTGKLAGLMRRGEIKGFSGITEMVDKILARAAGRKIGALHIYDHGAPGRQSFGNDWIGMDSDGELQGLRAQKHLDKGPVPLAALKRLTSHFASDGQVVLHGCQTAKGPKGPQLLAYLAQMWGVPVKASEVFQRPGIPGSGMQGSTVECDPETGEQADCERNSSSMDGVLDRDYRKDLGKLNPWPHMKKLKFW